MSTCSCRTLWLVMSCFCQLTNCCCSCCSRCSSCSCVSGAAVVEPGHTEKTPRWETDAQSEQTVFQLGASATVGISELARCLRVRRAPTRAILRSRKGQNHTQRSCSAFFFHQASKRTCCWCAARATHTPHSPSSSRSGCGRSRLLCRPRDVRTPSWSPRRILYVSEVGAALELCNARTQTHTRARAGV
jgi:hypothetical protein